MTEQYYSAPEAAAIFKVSRMAVVRWIKKGEINAIKVGRNYVIPRSSIIEKLGKTIGEEKKIEIEKAIDKALKDYEKTFKMLGKE